MEYQILAPSGIGDGDWVCWGVGDVKGKTCTHPTLPHLVDMTLFSPNWVVASFAMPPVNFFPTHGESPTAGGVFPIPATCFSHQLLPLEQCRLL